MSSAQPARVLGAGRFFWLWAAVWLFYMAGPILDAWHRPEAWERIVGLVAAVAFCGVYLTGFMATRRHFRSEGRPPSATASGLRVGAMVGCAAALTLIVGESGLTTLVYIAVMAVFTYPPRAGWSVVFASALTAGILPRVVPGWDGTIDLLFAVMVAALAVWGVTRVVQRNAQLAEAREEITRLAIAAERNRFGRDMHDLLGHSLTVVSVKSELAARLVQLAPERAEAELADIQRLVREALTDVRAAVAGYREMSLATELASARSALDAAGIEADVPVTGEAVDPDRRELFAWVVREGVTNVVRHSEAKHCWVRLDRAAVEISDDGRGPAGLDAQPAEKSAGHGLDGLRERLDAAGYALTIGRRDGGGFLLRAAAS
ncbi:sensor histidine kinase [Dactylosporangium vinaceum]|uniref:Sensor histidine kinase n=1 Tax=Dactylosporangium vinaceum TaxID=53362 RepID=A0ABV5M492_9ACTN|nr:sensor histidine kinase [Dactylosporangium vinaceum]UAB93408.1 sensor histidine kinase [Dactylosporangium vinaceum]